MTALALSGCMRTTGPVAVVSPSDLDSMAYGQPYSPPPRTVAMDSGGGAIGALRSAFAAAPRAAAVPPPEQAVYVEPMPVAAPARYDAVYHLDAGDKLRVVVYGQEGLTNTYAIDAGGSITMPLIGSVAGARPHHGGTGVRNRRQAARRLSSAIPRSPSKSNPTGRSSSSAKSQPPGNIPTCRT